MITAPIAKKNDLESIENPLIGDRVTFVRTAAATGGRQTLLEVELAPKGGNGLHYHQTFDETFRCKRGQLSLEVDGRIIRLLPGQSAVAPAGSLHRFFNETERPVLFEVELNPGSEGFENGLRLAYGLARDGLCRHGGTPRRLDHLALLIELTETRIPGIFGKMEPLLRLIARNARRRGVEAELARRYFQQR